MGRVGRLDYWLRLLTFASVTFGLNYYYGGNPSWGFALGFAHAFAVRPRLHDLGMSGRWTLVPLGVSIVGIWFRSSMPVLAMILAVLFGVIIVGLGIMPSQPGSNRYGDPQPRKLRYPN